MLLFGDSVMKLVDNVLLLIMGMILYRRKDDDILDVGFLIEEYKRNKGEVIEWYVSFFGLI